MRLAPIQLPLNTPYFAMACSVYREHVGSKRQLDGSHAKTTRYRWISPMAMRFTISSVERR